MTDSDIRIWKPDLRFKIGDIVYLRSDIKRKTPMTITNYDDPGDVSDYVLKYLTSQKVMETIFLADSALMP
jgi:hypothetical protein